MANDWEEFIVEPEKPVAPKKKKGPIDALTATKPVHKSSKWRYDHKMYPPYAKSVIAITIGELGQEGTVIAEMHFSRADRIEKCRLQMVTFRGNFIRLNKMPEFMKRQIKVYWKELGR